jgi:hypothetical protein
VFSGTEAASQRLLKRERGESEREKEEKEVLPELMLTSMLIPSRRCISITCYSPRFVVLFSPKSLLELLLLLCQKFSQAVKQASHNEQEISPADPVISDLSIPRHCLPEQEDTETHDPDF